MLPGSDGRLVRAKWAGLDSDLPAAGKRYPRNDNIRFPLPSKNLARGIWCFGSGMSVTIPASISFDIRLSGPQPRLILSSICI
jgi:hypothetical protein